MQRLEGTPVERSRRLPIPDVTDELDNVLRLRLAARDQAPADQRSQSRGYGRDWSAALDAVHEASALIAASEQRARDIEARGIALADRALKELKAAELRVLAAEDAMRAAEVRALEAEARAQEAEQWLARINDAIEDRLLPRQAPRKGTAAA